MIPLKVAMIMTDLDDLGVQRVVINLYNHFDRNNIDPTLIVWHKEGKVSSFLKQDKQVFETDPGLKKPRLLFRLFRYLNIIKTVEPDVILSFVPVTNLSMALIRPWIPRRVPIIMCEHAFLSRAFATGEYKGLFKHLYHFMLRGMYNSTSWRLVMTAQVGIDDAVDHWKLKPQKITLIRNPQDIGELRLRAAQPSEHPWLTHRTTPVLLAAGRLTPQKGFDRLLRACAKLIQARPCRLIILGRGELESELKALAESLNIAELVDFPGFQTNHLKFIANADLFVLSSVWEAMPMVVAETMAVGTPIVSFDCPSGPREMLDGGDCGFLVPDQDIDALAQTLAYALEHPQEAQAKAAKARAKVEDYDVAKIARRYQELMETAVQEVRG